MLKLELGTEIGGWVVVSPLIKPGRARYLCECVCGAKREVMHRYLVSGLSKSCGCIRTSTNKTHGRSETNDYRSWQAMLNRCRNKKTKHFHRYGGRGITVCDRWLSFENFLEDMGERPAGMTIDRINPDGNYEPGNCRWANRVTQGRNKATKGRACGVNRSGKKWKAYISTPRKKIYLGTFEDWFDAVCARKSAENKYWKQIKTEESIKCLMMEQ